MHQTTRDDVPEGREFIELLNRIERQIRPAKCRYLHFNYWPLMRFMLNANRKNRPQFPSTPLEEVSGRRVQELLQKAFDQRSTGRSRLQNIEAHTAKRFPPDMLEHLPQVDALFLTRKSQYRRSDGYCVEPLSDGIRLLTMGMGSQMTLVDQDPREAGDTFFSDTRVQPVAKGRLWINLGKPSYLAEYLVRERIRRTVRRVNAMIPDKYSVLRLSEGEFIRRVVTSSQRLMFWNTLLRQVRPKAVFLSSYTGVSYICTAGRRQGIPVIDVQHGGMHKHHPLAANWKFAPRAGYDTLPDVYWCWDQRSADYVDKFPINTHRTIVGGNPKTALDQHFHCDEVASVEPKKPQVLVALQYGSDRMVEPHLIEAYHATKDTVDWRFRLHPLGWSFLDEVVETFAVTKESVELESRRPLHKVLPQIDLMLCNASTIIHEAVARSIDGAVWTQKGASIFEDLVASGDVQVATDFSTLQDILTNLQRTAGKATLSETDQQKLDQNAMLVRDAYEALVNR